MILNSEPTYLASAYNKVEFSFFDSGYTIGDLYYLDVYQVTSRDLKQSPNLVSSTSSYVDTLVKNGSGDGNIKFDVSTVLQTMLDDVAIPSTSGFSNNYVGYRIATGRIVYNSSGSSKTQLYQSKVKWATRAALPLDGYDFGMWHVNYFNGNRKFLTNSPTTVEMGVDEEILLSAIIPKNALSASTINLKADIFRITGTSQTDVTLRTYQISSGGTYQFRINPSQIFTGATDIDRFSVWLDTDDAIIFGCPLPSAPNYNNLVTIDDGSCLNTPLDFNVVYSGYTISGNSVARQFIISGITGGEDGFDYQISTNGVNYSFIPATGLTYTYFSGGTLTFYLRRKTEVVSKTVQSPYFNSAVTSGITRNDCASGYTGTSVSYAVPLAKYSSMVSQANADAQAQTELTTSGQTQANLSGTCILLSSTIVASIRWANQTMTFPDVFGGVYSTADIYLDIKMNGNPYNPAGTLAVILRETVNGVYNQYTVNPTSASTLLESGYVLVDSSYNNLGEELYNNTKNITVQPGTGYSI